LRRTVIAAGAVLLALALLLYLYTLDNGLAPGELLGGDLITHQYAQVEARPSNAPGYPLYTMGGWLWFHGLRGVLRALGTALPNPIPILSSYSTVWAILALGLLYALMLRLTRSGARPQGNWVLAWLVGAFYAVTYFFWYYATTTEQYTSAIAQTLAMVLVYVLWAEAETPSGDSPAQGAPLGRRAWLLVLLAFLCGLALAHMLTVAFLVPPLVAAVVWQEPRVLRNWPLVGLCVAAAFLPLGSYWYVWVRGAAHPEWWGQGEWESAGAWFWSFVSTAQGRDELSWGFQPSCAFFDNGFPQLIWQELSVPLLVVGVGGISLLRRPLALVLYITLAIYVVFNWMYRCANWYQVILPAYPLVLLGVAAAAERWQTYCEGRRRGSAAWGVLAYAPVVLLVGAILWRGAASWERADSSDRRGDTAFARAGVLLDQALPPRSNLFAATEEALALDYLIRIWGVRPDLAVVSSAEAGERLGAGEAVYSTYDVAPVLLSELPEALPLQWEGAGPDWLALRAEDAAQPATQAEAALGPRHALEQELFPGVILKGYTVAAAPDGEPVTTAEPAADVTLYWGLLGEWPPALGISLRPTAGGAFVPDPGGEAGAIVQVDAPAPLRGLAPPGAALLADSYRVPLPAGANGITLIVYEKTGDAFRNLGEFPLDVERVADRQ
jgi:hypothetical protein